MTEQWHQLLMGPEEPQPEPHALCQWVPAECMPPRPNVRCGVYVVELVDGHCKIGIGMGKQGIRGRLAQLGEPVALLAYMPVMAGETLTAKGLERYVSQHYEARGWRRAGSGLFTHHVGEAVRRDVDQWWTQRLPEG